MSCPQTRLAQLKQENRVVLVTFVTAGNPDYVSSLGILKGLLAVGTDAIEPGMPFTDSMADGPAIQLANIRTPDDGQTSARTLQMVREFRSGDSKTPLVLMGYFSPTHHYGVERFIAEAREVGVDGLIMIDLPLEHNEDLCHPAQAVGLGFIRLTIPTIGDQRLPMVFGGSPGLIYYMSVAGVIGANAAIPEHVGEAVVRLRRRTDLPIGIGFDIRSAEHAAVVARLADGVVVGSALIDRIAKIRDNTQAVKNVLALCGELAEGVCNTR